MERSGNVPKIPSRNLLEFCLLGSYASSLNPSFNPKFQSQNPLVPFRLDETLERLLRRAFSHEKTHIDLQQKTFRLDETLDAKNGQAFRRGQTRVPILK